MNLHEIIIFIRTGTVSVFNVCTGETANTSIQDASYPKASRGNVRSSDNLLYVPFGERLREQTDNEISVKPAPEGSYWVSRSTARYSTVHRN